MNFKDLYVSYAKDLTDAPPQFHRALSYLIVSSVVGKNISMPFGYKKLYTNLFLLIGAPSSLHRKSWSQSMAVHIINMVQPGIYLPETSSREAFIAEMADEERFPRESGLITLDELGGFMKRIKHKRHFEGFMQDLSSAYDGHKMVRRIGAQNETKKTYTIDEPFLNLTSACSLDWLTQNTETEDISGGFLARFLWVIEDRPVANPKDSPGFEDRAKKDEILLQLNRMKDYLGYAHFDEEAKKKWGEWYTSFRGENQGGTWDANYERLTVIAKKLSILNAVMRLAETDVPVSNGAIEINISDLVAAVMFVEDTAKNFSKVIIGDSKEDVLSQRVMKFIQRRNKVGHSEVLRGVRGINAWSLKNIIQTLGESKVIKIIDTDETNNGRYYELNGYEKHDST